MTETCKYFEEWWLAKKQKEWDFPDATMPKGWGSAYKPNAPSAWQACQSLNDKRIQQLLAVIAVQIGGLEAIHRQIEHEPKRHNVMLAWNTVNNALSIKPENVELVEVGYTSEASMTNLITGNDVIVGKKTELRTEALYAIKKKGQ